MRRMKFSIALSLLVCGMLAALAAPAVAEFRVVVTIKPLHALVASVMSGVASPHLLVNGSGSPHTYALKPSDAAMLNRAHVLFRMSEALEAFTVKIASALPRSVEVVTLQDAPGLRLLPRRVGATFEQDGSAHGKDRRHGHSHSHAKDGVDSHAWLDPDNAKVMVSRIEQVLSARYPAHASAFQANSQRLEAMIDALAAELDRELKPVAGKPYIVFHDAFQYLERRYGLNGVGSISVSPEVPPSAKRLSELRQRIMTLQAVCVFAEPPFETRLVDNLVEGTNARTGTLDPEGGKLSPGPELYFTLMRRLAANLKSCLAAPV